MADRKHCISRGTAAFILVGLTLGSTAAHGVHSELGGLPVNRPIAAAPDLKPEEALRTSPEPKVRRLRVAHAVMARTRPEQGQAVPEGLQKVEIWYNSMVRDDFVTLAVLNAAGERIDKHDVTVDSADQTHVTTSVPALAPGAYTVRYRAISVDGFLASGSWAFQVQGKVATLSR